MMSRRSVAYCNRNHWRGRSVKTESLDRWGLNRFHVSIQIMVRQGWQQMGVDEQFRLIFMLWGDEEEEEEECLMTYEELLCEKISCEEISYEEISVKRLLWKEISLWRDFSVKRFLCEMISLWRDFLWRNFLWRDFSVKRFLSEETSLERDFSVKRFPGDLQFQLQSYVCHDFRVRMFQRREGVRQLQQPSIRVSRWKNCAIQ